MQAQSSVGHHPDFRAMPTRFGFSTRVPSQNSTTSGRPTPLPGTTRIFRPGDGRTHCANMTPSSVGQDGRLSTWADSQPGDLCTVMMSTLNARVPDGLLRRPDRTRPTPHKYRKRGPRSTCSTRASSLFLGPNGVRRVRQLRPLLLPPQVNPEGHVDQGRHALSPRGRPDLALLRCPGSTASGADEDEDGGAGQVRAHR